jgi:hypothetical protein
MIGVVAIAHLEGAQESPCHGAVHVAWLVQLVEVEECLADEEEGVSARGLLQRERVVVPRVQTRQRIRPCTVADRERLVEHGAAKDACHGLRQHPECRGVRGRNQGDTSLFAASTLASTVVVRAAANQRLSQPVYHFLVRRLFVVPFDAFVEHGGE